MDANWVAVYSTDQMYKAMLIQKKLSEEDITSVIVNKRDSLYAFGDIEIHVNPENAIKSIYLIKKQDFE